VWQLGCLGERRGGVIGRILGYCTTHTVADDAVAACARPSFFIRPTPRLIIMMIMMMIIIIIMMIMTMMMNDDSRHISVFFETSLHYLGLIMSQLAISHMSDVV